MHVDRELLEERCRSVRVVHRQLSMNDGSDEEKFRIDETFVKVLLAWGSDCIRTNTIAHGESQSHVHVAATS